MFEWLAQIDWRKASGWSLFTAALGAFLWRGSHIIVEHAREDPDTAFDMIVWVEIVGQGGLILLTVAGLYIGLKKKGETLTSPLKRPKKFTKPK